jgi:Flp pilus assembly protein TadG
MTPLASHAPQADRGSASVELTLLTPLMVVLLLFIVAAARLTTARLTVQEAAQQAARTLTLARDTADAVQRARDAAQAVTTGQHLPCRHLDLTTTLPPATGRASIGTATAAGASGSVAVITVRLACTVDLSDVTGLALPSSTVVTARVSSPVDRYRS